MCVHFSTNQAAEAPGSTNSLLSETSSTGGTKAVALVVDATVTSYLMMGNLPGLKRHAVRCLHRFRPLRCRPPLVSELKLLYLAGEEGKVTVIPAGSLCMQVTLFEGGRVSGTEPMGSLISELQVSLNLYSAREELPMDLPGSHGPERPAVVSWCRG